MALPSRPYRKNEIRMASINFLSAAIVYAYAMNELVNAKNIFTDKFYGTSLTIIGLAVVLFLGTFITAIYQRNYNRKLIEAGTFEPEGRFGTERSWSNAAAILTVLIGICLFIIPYLEIRQGVATGGLLFQNHKLTNDSELFWHLIYFHLALAVALIIGGILLLIFRPPKAIKPIETGNNFAFNLVKNANDEAKNIVK